MGSPHTHSEINKLLQELLSMLEGKDYDSLVPILRKAVRLSSLIDEPEYRYIFQVHIDGWPKGKVGRSSAQRWDNSIKPRWDIIGMAMEDRTNSEGMVQGLSLNEIENMMDGMKRDIQYGEATILTHELLQELGTIHNRISARIIDFAIKMQKKLLDTNSARVKVISPENTRTGHIFIGHGQSNVWRDLKDFVQERLNLTYDEFNRESTPGITVIERLEIMLAGADFAFIVMTAEDEHSDGSLHARGNVIHEAGLFQGKLGFRKAIILLEETCSEFSNITGLTQIRFPKGNILAKSEEIRRVLEREGVLKTL